MKYFRGCGISILSAAALGCSSIPVSEALPGAPLDPGFVARVVELSLHCVDQEEPHAKSRREDGALTERNLHPAFYGCYDWHSAVHGHWAMLRVADVWPNSAERDRIVETLARHLTSPNLHAELAYLARRPDFERPYGWGWFLRLAEELRRSPLPAARAWREAAAPLEQRVSSLLGAYFRELREANRSGMHANSAFSLSQAWDFAKTAERPELLAELEKAARRLYFADHDCALAGEPGPTDFLSPCFAEADLMRRVLGPEEFTAWFDGFLPSLGAAQLRPRRPTDLKDYLQVHLVGLMFEKASAMEGVASRLPTGDSRRALLTRASAEHADLGGKLMYDSGYGGTHWLASFAIYYYSRVGH